MSDAAPDPATLAAECRRRVDASPNRPAEIDAADFLRADLDDPNTPILIDIRPEDERAEAGAIPNTRVIPMERLADEFVIEDPDRPVVAYCRSGRRSLFAAEILRAKGVNYPLSLRGGIKAWRAAGGRLV